MADWGSALTARLLDDAALSAAVGGRIDWNVRPDMETLPALILQTVSDPRPDHFGGEQDLRQTRVQGDCWSLISADHATQIAEKFIAAVRPLPGQAGAYDDGSWERDGVRFDRPQVEGPVDGGEQLDTVYVHRARVDVLLWHCEIEGV